MRVLLIEPRSCWVGLSTSLAYVAAALRSAGHEVRGLSLTNHREHDPNQLLRYFVEGFSPDMIGYSIYYTSVHSLINSVRHLRGYYRGPIVVGGPQMNIERAEILKDVVELDYAVVGEGEQAVVELCEALKGDRSLETIDGLIYRNNGKIVHNDLRKPNRNLDKLPFPDHAAFGVKSMYTYYLSSSRGCPFQCTFCFRSSSIWRARSPESMIAELKHAVDRYQIREFCITDDSINVKPGRIVRFCELLREEDIDLPWYCSGARADRLEDNMLLLMRETGCYRISVGVETMQPDVYAKINKGESLEEIVAGIAKAKSYGFEVFGYFMIGIPGDTPEGTMDTYRRAQELALDFLAFSILLPFPGTAVYEELMRTPQVRWLRDYRTVSTAWTYDPEWCEMKSSFELPEYPEKVKVDLFHKIKTKQGDPRPPYHRNHLLFALHALWYVLKYDRLHSPLTLARLAGNVLTRLIKSKGRTLSMIVVEYEKDYLPSVKELSARHD